MSRRTWILVIGPPTIEDQGLTPNGRRWLLSAPHGIGTLAVFADSWASEHELRTLGTCWFRDAFANEVRRVSRAPA